MSEEQVGTWQWTSEQLDQFEVSLPTIEDEEKSGVWVSTENSGYSSTTLWAWRVKLLLKETDYFSKIVRVRRAGSTFRERRMFYRRSAIKRIAATNRKARSEWVSAARRKHAEDIVDGKETWMIKGRTAVYLGVTPDTVDVWSDIQSGGCPLLEKSAPLSTTERFPPYKRWALSVLDVALKRLQDNPDLFRADIYPPGFSSLETTRTRTGVGKKKLYRTKKSAAVGLDRVIVTVYTVRSGHLTRVNKAAFTDKSIEEFLRKSKPIPKDKMKLADVARKLKIGHSTALHWWRAGWLEGGFEEYTNTNKVPREGILIPTNSYKTARAALSSAKGNVWAAALILKNPDNTVAILGLLIKPNELTITQVVKDLNGPAMETVIGWCEDSLLAAEHREHLTLSGIREKGWLIKKTVCSAAKKILNSVHRDTRKARLLLLAQRDSRNGPPIAAPETGDGQPVTILSVSEAVDQPKIKKVREPTERVLGYYKICFDHRRKHLVDPESYPMAKAAHDAMKLLPPNYLGTTLDEQKSRLRNFAKRYEKHCKKKGVQT